MNLDNFSNEIVIIRLQIRCIYDSSGNAARHSLSCCIVGDNPRKLQQYSQCYCIHGRNSGNLLMSLFCLISQITINNVNYTLSRLQSASIASNSSLSGLLITGDRPFAVVSSCMRGFTLDSSVGGFDNGNYEAVSKRLFFD